MDRRSMAINFCSLQKFINGPLCFGLRLAPFFLFAPTRLTLACSYVDFCSAYVREIGFCVLTAKV